MVESLFFIGGEIIGSGLTHVGYLVASKTIQKTYVELTEMPNTVVEDKEQQRPELPEGYDWSTYDSYIQRAEEEEDIIPES